MPKKREYISGHLRVILRKRRGRQAHSYSLPRQQRSQGLLCQVSQVITICCRLRLLHIHHSLRHPHSIIFRARVLIRTYLARVLGRVRIQHSRKDVRNDSLGGHGSRLEFAYSERARARASIFYLYRLGNRPGGDQSSCYIPPIWIWCSSILESVLHIKLRS